MTNTDQTPQFGAIACRMAYSPSDNPFTPGSDAHKEWDRDYWAEHDAMAPTGPGPDEDGIEAGYGDWWAEASMSHWDDDPSPYNGTYSEM
jgi:hypothetical protein